MRAAGEDVAVSVITLIELAHGVARANTPREKLPGDSTERMPTPQNSVSYRGSIVQTPGSAHSEASSPLLKIYPS